MLAEEEDVSSECSSGCQSGWTAYLDRSSFESPRPFASSKAGSFRREEEEEEDLSMVSDASSGPPHFHEDDEHSYCFQGCGCLCTALTPAAGLRKKRRVEPERAQGRQQRSSLLDDTASSPLLISYPKTSSDEGVAAGCFNAHLDGVLEFSCGSSATHFKKKYGLENQMGFLQSSAASAKQTPAGPVHRRGKKQGGDGRSIPSPYPLL